MSKLIFDATLRDRSRGTEYLLLSDPMNGDFGSDDFKILFEQMVAAPAGQLLNSRYGSMIDTAQLLQGNFDAYACFFTQIANPVNKKGLFRKPKGSYLRTFCKGDWSQIPATYERMLAYAEEHRLTLTGYAYEEGINEMVISSIDEYVAQITVRCFASEEVKGAFHFSENVIRSLLDITKFTLNGAGATVGKAVGLKLSCKIFLN